MTLTAAASGCTSAEYKWWVMPPGGSWAIVRDWGAAAFSWNTTGLAAGTYQLFVYARAVGSAADYQAYSGQPYVLIGP